MELPLNIAMFGPAELGVMIPIIIFMIPIVAILASHQQKMAQIIHGNSQSNEVLDLRRQVAELRSLIERQSYAIDQLNNQASMLKTTTVDLPVRLGSEI